MRALAVFHGDSGGHWAERWLKPGFKHVFVCLQVDAHWIRIDSMAGVPDVNVVTGRDYDLAGFYRRHGFSVLELERGDAEPRGPLVVANCVGLAKVMLGIRAPLVWTPWRLFKRLLKQSSHVGCADQLRPHGLYDDQGVLLAGGVHDEQSTMQVQMGKDGLPRVTRIASGESP